MLRVTAPGLTAQLCATGPQANAGACWHVYLEVAPVLLPQLHFLLEPHKLRVQMRQAGGGQKSPATAQDLLGCCTHAATQWLRLCCAAA